MKENGFKDYVRCTFYAFMATILMVLIFSVVIKYADISDKAILGVNIAIKGISIMFGVVKGTKCLKLGAIKGATAAVTYCLICYLTFLALDGGASNASITLFDFIFAAVVGLVGGILAVNIKNSTQNG